jgi:acyl-coenzyme A thioesterase PaaI-like protein
MSSDETAIYEFVTLFRPGVERPVQRRDGSVRRAWQGLMAHLGAALLQVRLRLVIIRMPFRNELTQQHGYFYTGGLSAIADSAGGHAGFTLLPERLTQNYIETTIRVISVC